MDLYDRIELLHQAKDCVDVSAVYRVQDAANDSGGFENEAALIINDLEALAQRIDQLAGRMKNAPELCNVVLKGWGDPTMGRHGLIQMIKNLRDAVHDIAPLGLKEAKGIVDKVYGGVPATVLNLVSEDEALNAVEVLKRKGTLAVVEVERPFAEEDSTSIHFCDRCGKSVEKAYQLCHRCATDAEVVADRDYMENAEEKELDDPQFLGVCSVCQTSGIPLEKMHGRDVLAMHDHSGLVYCEGSMTSPEAIYQVEVDDPVAEETGSGIFERDNTAQRDFEAAIYAAIDEEDAVEYGEES